MYEITSEHTYDDLITHLRENTQAKPEEGVPISEALCDPKYRMATWNALLLGVLS